MWIHIMNVSRSRHELSKLEHGEEDELKMGSGMRVPQQRRSHFHRRFLS